MKQAFLSISFRLLLFLVCFRFSCAKLTFQVEPKTTNCFYEDFSVGEHISVSFFILRGGLLDIDLRIIAPNGEQLYSGLEFESGMREFVVRLEGPYQICWNNEMARFTAKVIQFEISKGEKSSENGPLTKDTLAPLEQSLNRISGSLENIQREQKYLHVREQVHRDTAESTNFRVQIFSVIESIALLSISIGQAYYLRNFFETKHSA